MAKTIVILQSSYIPWLGYFHLMNLADEFIIYDDVQMSSSSDWRSRNRIRNVKNDFWLKIPILTTGHSNLKINQVQVSNSFWAKKHFRSIQVSYFKAPFYKKYESLLKKAYEESSHIVSLSEINLKFLYLICDILNIKTPITFSADYGFQHLKKTDRLVEICRAAKATKYLTGVAAKDYIEPEKFKDAGVKLEYMRYPEYPAYPQLGSNFISRLSILDAIFNMGEDTMQMLQDLELTLGGC